MGLFDEVVCELALPDDPLETVFQTKSFPDPLLRRYTITRAGRLVDADGQDWEPDGEIVFYGTATKAQWTHYCASFVAGNLKSMSAMTQQSVDAENFGLNSFRWHSRCR